MASSYKIAVVGLWQCGEIYSACLAELGHEVMGISEDEEVISNFQKIIPPLPEPELQEFLRKNISSKRLRYTTDFAVVKDCEVVWFTLDTPVDEKDDIDMEPIYSALKKAIFNAQDNVLFVMSSQVPIGTADRVCQMIKEARPGLQFDYVYTPENLRLGEAVRSFMDPGRIVIGADTEEGWKKINDIFLPLKTNLLHMSCVSAEMTKHALNAFLATSVSFINDIADLCEKTHADVIDVIKALRSDPRIGPKAFLDAGLGFSGGTLGRDLRALQSSAQKFDMKLPVITSVFEKNIARKDLVLARLQALLHDLKGKKIALLGLTYKPGTKTLRRSRALEIAVDLSNRGAILTLYDPAVDEKEVPEIKNATFLGDPYSAADSASAIVITTPWPEFKNLDFQKMGKVAKGAVLLDTANLLYDKEEIIKGFGLYYFGVGR